MLVKGYIKNLKTFHGFVAVLLSAPKKKSSEIVIDTGKYKVHCTKFVGRRKTTEQIQNDLSYSTASSL